MSTGIIAVIFLFVCGCLAALAVAVRFGQYAGAGILGVLMITGLLLFASAYSPPSGQTEALKSEIATLKNQINTIKDKANNPAYLAGICLAGAGMIVGIMFFGVYGLIIIQAKIRKSEKQDNYRAEQAYIPHTEQPVHLLPEPVQTIAVYHDAGHQYAVTQYQGY